MLAQAKSPSPNKYFNDSAGCAGLLHRLIGHFGILTAKSNSPLQWSVAPTLPLAGIRVLYSVSSCSIHSSAFQLILLVALIVCQRGVTLHDAAQNISVSTYSEPIRGDYLADYGLFKYFFSKTFDSESLCVPGLRHPLLILALLKHVQSLPQSEY